LHDGRTSDLLVAIQAHASTDSEESRDSGKSVGGYPASEATAVVRKFNALSSTDKQAILDFLRSL
ncbi:MAG TPA: hypothetical protein VMT32_03005, partial [Bryobacteraceae bacterium]|nr:hypothetical protein [Bryobacteraceae bacterium]